jgi:tRNA A-37 threonylcarbamoyl transferase component Bud32
MDEQDFYDFRRCVRPNGTAYGTGGQCRKGDEQGLSQRVGKKFLAQATTQKLEEYARRAPHKYQRDAIKAELARRAGKPASGPAGSKQKPKPLDGPTNRALQREKDKLSKEQKVLQKELDALIAQRDGGAPDKKDKLSKQINAGFLAKAPKEKLEEYLKRAPHKYQRDRIQKALDERAKMDAEKSKPIPPGIEAVAQMNLRIRGEKETPSALKREAAAVKAKFDAENQAAAKLESNSVKAKNLPPADSKLFRALNPKDLDDLEKHYIKDGSPEAMVRLDALRRERARRAGQANKQAQQKAQAAGAPNAWGKFADDQLRNRLQAAKQLGKDDMVKEIEAEMLRRAKANPADPGKWKKWGDEELRDQRSVLIRQGKVGDVDDVEAEMARRGLAKRPLGLAGLPQKVSKWTHENMVRLDERVERDTQMQMGKEDFVWGNSLKKGAKLLGEGAYGTAIVDKNDVVVKRGTVGENEAKLIDRIGKVDLGPKLIAAQYDGPGYERGTHDGRIAMTRVPGSPIGKKKGDDPVGKTGKVVSDVYWEARAKLHRMGIAHNDMHIENVFIDRNGNGRFVDMGLAQAGPKAALAEAMGVFTRVPQGAIRRGGSDAGDWQVRRWDGTAGKEMVNAEMSTSSAVKAEFARRFPTAARVLENKEKAIKKLKSFGLTDQDVADVISHGIRKREKSFNERGMGKLTDAQARQVIEVLYDGI